MPVLICLAAACAHFRVDIMSARDCIVGLLNDGTMRGRCGGTIEWTCLTRAMSKSFASPEGDIPDAAERF